MRKPITWIALISIVLLMAGCGATAPAASTDTKAPVAEAPKAWTPDSTIEIVAPAGPGGGYDTLARTMERTLTGDKLVDKPIIITNKSGGGGATGWTYLNTHKESGNFFAANSPQIIQNNLLGASKLSYKDFTPLAMLQAEWEAVVVPKDSPYKTGKEFFEALKADPSQISVAVGPALGNDDHIQFLMLAKAYGITDMSKVKFVVYPGAGGEEVPALLGGHVQAMTISLGEAKEQYKAGNVKILGISADKRLTGDLADIPTWKEQGVDVVFPHWRGVVGPGGMTPEQIAYWDKVFSKMSEQQSWKDAMAKQNMDVYYKNSADYKAYLEKSTQEESDLLKSVGLIK